MAHDPARLKLGRKEARVDDRTLKLARYMTPKSLPAIPDTIDWSRGTEDFGMRLNDLYGCCTASAAAHLFTLWNDRVGRHACVVDPDVLAMYMIVTKAEGWPFNPDTMENDNGCVMLDAVKNLRSWGIAGRKIDAFVSVDVRRHELLKAAIYLFGGIYVGVALPISAQNQGVWRVTDRHLNGDARPGSWGGHCIAITGYDKGGLNCVTWGEEKRMTWDWWDAYGDEAFALLAQDWIGANALSPSAFNMAQLKADLAKLGS